MAVYFRGPRVLGNVDPTALTLYGHSTVQEYPLGTVIDAEDGSQFMYVKCTTDIAVASGGVGIKVDLVTYVASICGAGDFVTGIVDVAIDGTPTAAYFWLRTGGKVVDAFINGGTAGVPFSAVSAANGQIVAPIGDAVAGNGAGEQVARGIVLEAPTGNKSDLYIFPLF